MGTQGQLASPSDSTVEGGPGLVLDNLPQGALGSQLVHVDLVGVEGGVQRSVVHVNLLKAVLGIQLVSLGSHSVYLHTDLL